MIYAMSDIHGCIGAFEKKLEQVDLSGDNRLILLGDYIDYGRESGQVLEKVFDLQNKHGEKKVIVLKGNHEAALLDWIDDFKKPVTPAMEAAMLLLTERKETISWLRKMPLLFKTDRQIFVHAGVNEEAEDLWESGTEEYVFLWKFPVTPGPFYKTIISGHVGTGQIAKDKSFHDIYFDGQSHYFIDGSVYGGGRLNLLAYDEEKDRYYAVEDDGKMQEVKPYTSS